METTKIAVFKGRQVRKTLHNNQWWFSVEDVVAVLTDSINPKDYINKMRRRDEELAKGYGQFVHTLLMSGLLILAMSRNRQKNCLSRTSMVPGYVDVSEKIGQLKLHAQDGKQYIKNAAT